ncbi:MAG TPA: type II toxin-antitoxin system Phd/YefM family antitoxin [Acetobacteraceae bacterium]|jgi:prevent-host-death family protein
MQTFRSLHFQKNLGDVLAAVAEHPVVLLNRGQPRAVVMSAEEFRRLKRAANEPVPAAAQPVRRQVFRVGQQTDPLGYDTSNFAACVRDMAADALSGGKGSDIRNEADHVRDALREAGLLPATADRL